MKQNCVFCKGADIVEVVPNLGVDVHNAIETGIIEDKSASVFHNMMKDLGEVGMVARDPFDIIEYERSYSKFRKYVKDKEDSKDKDKDK